MTTCPSEDELILLLDGEATLNAASQMRAHIAACARCRQTWGALEQLAFDLGAKMPAVDTDRAVNALMQRIALDSPALPSPSRAPGRVFAAVAAAIAVAAGIALFVRARPAPHDEIIAARGSAGGAAWTLHKAVGVSFYRVDTTAHPLTAGDVVPASTKLTLAYRNLRDRDATYLMAFAIDEEETVHWLFPAYERFGENPESVALAPTAAETLMAQSVVLDQPSHGALRLVSIVSATPRHVADIESLAPRDRSLAALRARWPDASIDETTIAVP